MTDSERTNVKIPGGCPDGFWALANCNAAARLGFCSLVTKSDTRVVATEDGIATVAGPARLAVDRG